MANFEALIKQALKTQNSADPAVREKIYNSSRSALRRMLEKAPNQTEDALNAHMRNLQETIIKIETEYAPPEPVAPTPAPPAPAPIPVRPVSDTEPVRATPTPSLIAEPVSKPNPLQPHINPNVGVEDSDFGQPNPVPQPRVLTEPEPMLEQGYVEPNYSDATESYDSVEVPPPSDNRPQYKRSNPFLRRIWWVLFLVAGLMVAIWLLYALSSKFGDNSATSQQTISGQQASQSRTDQESTYITLLSAEERNALLIDGRGSAEIVNELNAQLLRIQSIRQGASADIAEPILLELQPGVLRQIAGKEITVEIRAKSGGANPATFSVECDFAGKSSCGRKRFRVGLQPEDIIFALKIDPDVIDGNSFLAINTDVTSSADTSGTGDVVDIIYARIRMAK